MALHKRLDVRQPWPARGATSRGSCRVHVVACHEEYVCDGLAGNTILVAAPTAGRRGRSGQVVPDGPNFFAFGTRNSIGMWTPETPRRPLPGTMAGMASMASSGGGRASWRPVRRSSAKTTNPQPCFVLQASGVVVGSSTAPTGMDQGWNRLEPCNVETGSLGRGQQGRRAGFWLPIDHWASATGPIAPAKVRRCISTNQPPAHGPVMG